MASRFLRTSYIVAKCSFCQKVSKTTVQGINLSSNYCYSVSVSSKSSNNEKLKIKKKGQSSANVSHGNILDTINKTTFYETENAEEISILNEQNLESKNISKDLFDKKIQKIRNQTFNHSLASYISVCIHSGLHNAAFATFKHFKNLEKNCDISESLNLKTYKEVLKGIANQGDLQKMKEVLLSLEESSLKPDYNTIAYCLACLGRSENTPSVIEEIKSIFGLMEKHKMCVDEILGKAYFPPDSLECCLKAIERVTPNVKDKLQTLNSSKDYILKENRYQNKLVNKLNSNIFTNQGKSPAERAIPPDELPKMIQTQIENELKGYIEIPLINTKENLKAREEEKKLWQEWNEDWRKNLVQKLENYNTLMRKSFANSESVRINEFPYLNVLNNEDIVELLLQEVRIICSNQGFKTYNEMAYDLGHKFFNQFQIRYKENARIFPALRKAYEKYCYWYLLRSDPDASSIPRVEWNNILAKENSTSKWKDNPIEWPYTVKLAIGHKLYKFIFESVRVWRTGESKKKAFIYQIEKNKKKLEPTHTLLNIHNMLFENVLTYPTFDLPLLSPPVPWTDVNNGAYFFTKSNFVKLISPKYQHLYWLEEGEMPKLYPAMDTLNAHGSIPWKINCNMLDIIIEVFSSGGSKESGVFTNTSSMYVAGKDFKEKKLLKIEQYSWDFQLQKLSLANYYRNSIFWMPHCIDFRGRCHPIGRNFNYFLPDVYRSFLNFAQGKKLGKDGLTWLKLHLCNLTGMVKRSSIEDRLKFVDKMMDEIIDSAKNPLDGKKWWKKCGQPWQALAACKELVAALESECPEEYVSHLPIYQDGSCNALQHYAGLMKNKEAAAFVNLRPSDTPQDLYSHIAELMNNVREKDAREGLEVAHLLEDWLDRKLIKPACVAGIYGTSGSDAFLTLLLNLRNSGFSDEYLDAAAHYLAPKVSQTLSTTFLPLKHVKEWIVKLTEGISQHCGSNIEFESPLGLPVVQPNTKEPFIFPWQTDIITSFIPGSVFTEPDAEDQKNRFVGNFTQTLDSSHMMLTSLYCQQAGVSFVSVHDSFWSHASTVSALSKICREQFIQLYSQNILEDLAQFMIEKYSSHPNYKHCYTTLSEEDPTPASLEDLLKNVPQKGDFDLDEVLRSTFFFS